ncbi:MAG: ABC transporter permease, partial [Pseudomonadota bacterium]
MQRINPVSVVFLVLSLLGLMLSGMRPTFVLNEMIIRFIRDGVMVLALIIPINAGMGLNFAIVVGAMCAQVGLVLAVDLQLTGFAGLFFIAAIGITLSLLLGMLIGLCLNRVKGKEMITTIIIGFLATSIYQLVFMVGYGTIIHPHNSEMMLSRGIGIRNMIDLQGLRNILDNLWLLKLGEIEIPVFMIMLVLLFAGIVQYIINTRLGRQFLAAGLDSRKAEMVGINTELVRMKAIILSTVIACCGHILYIENIGMLNVYTAHLNSDIFSCAAILAGGATIFRARISNALIGVLLFHSFFIVSPQAGQNIFGNPALGEYFRSFVAYGTIA